MGRQMGARVQILGIPETTYGTAPGGNYQKLPIMSYEVGLADDLVENPAIGFGHREMLDPFRGPISVKGAIAVPVDLRNIGVWLKPLFGSYSVTGAGPYTHVFKCAALTQLPSLTVEYGNPDAGSTGEFFLHTGLSINKGSFDLQPTGPAKLTLDAIAQNEVASASSGGGTPTSVAFQPFSQLQGTLNIDAVDTLTPASVIANVVGAKFDIENQIDAQAGVAAQGLILGADAGQAKVSGSVTVRFSDLQLYNLAATAAVGSLSFGYKASASQSLLFVMPRVSWGRSTPKVTGPSGIQASFNFSASRDLTTNESVITTLVNDVPTY